MHYSTLSPETQHLYCQSYNADYFGYKIHVEQNKKLAMFGVTHICAKDGKVVGFITMPVKNNVVIYSHLYRYLGHDFKDITCT